MAQLLVTAHLLLNIQAHGVGGAQAEDGRLSTVSTQLQCGDCIQQCTAAAGDGDPGYVSSICVPARGPATLALRHSASGVVWLSSNTGH